LRGGAIVEKTPELLERIKNYKPKTKAPTGYNRMVESIPGGFVITKRVEKAGEAEKAKA
jgi:hypothetical protein